MSVDAIGLSAGLLKAVKESGYKNLTPIQQQAIPLINKGEDLLASAQTGTGKTAAFTLPIIDRLAKNTTEKTHGIIEALILVPTRELAVQVHQNVEKYSQYLPITSGVLYGGVALAGQSKMLKQGINVLVATPGRLLEHLALRNLSLSQVQFLVLDEADRMLDMGFLADIEKILQVIKKRHQTLMFSATFSNKVKVLAKQILVSPKTVEVAKQNSTSGKVRQLAYRVSEIRKRELLSELIGVNNWQQVLVFAGTQASANELAKELKLDGFKVALCHGGKPQGTRNKALEQFANGQVRILVATDVAARGLDIDELAYVVNFHLPFLAEDYVHRIGRTGRAGKKGVAISLVSPKDDRFLENIETVIGRQLEPIVVPGYELDKPLPAQYDNVEIPLEKKNRYKATQEKNQAIVKKNQQKKQKGEAKKPKRKKPSEQRYSKSNKKKR